MKKKLYLHIGTTKTGTSSWQDFICDNREWLREQGYLVPESERKDHHPLASSIMKGFSGGRFGNWDPFEGDHETLWQRFHEEVDHSDCPVVLVSSEYFRHLDSEACRRLCDGSTIRWLGQQLKDLDVRVVCYLRPLGAHVKSHYKQHVKYGNISETLAQRLARQIESKSPHVLASPFLNIFAGEFGADHLILRRYDRSTLVNGSIIDDFCDLLGLPPQAEAWGDNQSNPSLPDESVDIKRTLNAVANKADKQAVKNIGLQMARMPATPFDARPADGGKAIRQALEDEHQAIAERYGLDLGEVSDPFADTPDGPTENQATIALMSLVWKEVRDSRQAQQKLQDEAEKSRKETQALREEVRASRQRIDKLAARRNPVRRVAKYIARKLRELRSVLAPTQKNGQRAKS